MIQLIKKKKLVQLIHVIQICFITATHSFIHALRKYIIQLHVPLKYNTPAQQTFNQARSGSKYTYAFFFKA